VRDPRIRCKSIRSPKGATVTEMDWADGHVGVYPHDVLRGFCPCAGCQGHEGAIRFIPPSALQLELAEIEPVGNYALCLKWFDGHASGLYSYTYLRALCHCSSCRPQGRTDEELPRA
jgi:DUF971 family protein